MIVEFCPLYDFRGRIPVVTGGNGMLVSKISDEDCARLYLGYIDPAKIYIG
jgi:hypothetical protein